MLVGLESSLVTTKREKSLYILFFLAFISVFLQVEKEKDSKSDH